MMEEIKQSKRSFDIGIKQLHFIYLYSLIDEAEYSSALRYIQEGHVTEKIFRELLEVYPRGRVANPIVTAIDIGNVDIFNALIEAGFDPSGSYPEPEEDFGEVTPIQLAIRNNQTAIVKSLTEKHHVDVTSGSLVSASIRCDVEITEALVSAGASIEKDTPLHWAVHGNQVQTCKYLLAAGANVNARDDEAWTPLHLAIRYRTDMDIVQALLDAGADVNLRNAGGQTPFVTAVQTENLELMKFLYLKGSDPEVKDDQGNTPLHHAVQMKNYSSIYHLLTDNHVLPGVINDDGKTAFTVAVRDTRDMDAVKLFNAAGYHPSRETDVTDGTVHEDEEGQNFLSQIRQMASMPYTLQESCCITIRRLTESVDRLDLPERIKELLIVKCNPAPL